MEEQLISLKTSKLAKEMSWNGDFIESEKILTTQSLLAKWLREIHNIHIEIELWKNSLNKKYLLFIYSEYGRKQYYSKEGESLFNTYEEALEEALKQSLKLIK